MSELSRENRNLLFRLCVMWALVSGCWVVLQVSTPLILKDVVGAKVAPSWQGVFTATTALSGMVFCGLTGYFSDHVGRLEFLIPWVCFFFFTSLFVAYADYYKMIYPLWFARVAALSIPSTLLHAFLSDYLCGNELLEAFSLLSASFGGSMLVGSLICGYLGWRFSRIASLLFGSFSAANATVVSFFVKLPSVSRFTSPTGEKSDFLMANRSSVRSSLRVITRDALLRNLIIALAIFRVSSVNNHMMLVLFVNYRLGWGLVEMSILTGVTSFMAVVVQIIGIKMVISSDVVLQVFFFALALVPVVSFGYSVVMTGFQLCLVSFLGAITTIATTIFNAKITALAAENGVAGLALGCVGTVQNLVEIGASLFFGDLQSWSATNYAAKDILSGLPFMVNGVFVSFALCLVLYSHKRYGGGRTSWEDRVSLL